eukprot:m.19852 g.19852  ORF g.19852 m.19852 type:complete len:232 (+) comp6691_c0_seq1:85-780(+)
MSSLLGLFGGSGGGQAKRNSGPDTSSALEQLSSHIETLDKKSEHLTKIVLQEKAKAVEFHKKGGKVNKSRAMQHLKQAKAYEQQIEQTENMRGNLFAQKMALESQATNQATLKVMHTSATAMKNSMDVNKVEDMVADVEELVDQSREVTEALTRDMGLGVQVDQDELDAEMEELLNDPGDLAEIEGTNPALNDLPSTQDLNPLLNIPSAPTKTPTTAEDDELAELQMFAAT